RVRACGLKGLARPDVPVERDSIPLHVLAGVPEQDKMTVAGLLRNEPSLWSSYGAWLVVHEPAIWQEIRNMAKQRSEELALDFGPLAEYLHQTGKVKALVTAVGVKEAVEAVGVKEVVQAVGVKEAVEALGVKHLWDELSQQQREELLRL